MKLLLAALVLLLLLLSGNPCLTAQNLLLFDGETPDVETCGYEYGNANNQQAHAGQWCFEGIPDQWHRPAISMSCQGVWRKSLEHYDYLQFWAKASEPGRTFAVSIYGWPHESPAVNINPYILGGPLDTVYRLVRIPIDSFKTPDYPINSIEWVNFGTCLPGQTHHIFIDDLKAIDATPNRVDAIQWLSDRVVKLTVHERYDTNDVKILTHYRLRCLQDANYTTWKNPTSVGIHYFMGDFEDGTAGPQPVDVFELFLTFPHSLADSKRYTLDILDIKDLAGNHFPVSKKITTNFQAWKFINGSVKVNQVGYLPVSRKYAYVGNYLGTGGMMPLSPTVFQVRKASGNAVVFSGTPVLRGNDLQLSGEKVYACDFTAFATPGNYYVYVPGVGRSYAFVINNNVFNSVAKTTGRALFYQRCGGPIDSIYAGLWHRPACHTADGVIHSSCADTPLYNDEPIDSTYPVLKGWHDAGDYGKYVPPAAYTLNTMMTAWELFPNKFPDDWGIPESNNGIPDVLDEARWELEWMSSMLAPDGGAYFKCVTTDWPNTMPELDTATRYLAQKTTHTTGHACAVLAQAARIFAEYDPVFADTCLARAVRAWVFLENHLTAEPPLGYWNAPGIGGGDYPDPDGDADERAWAAAELYKTTGDSLYHAAFAYWWPQHPPYWGWNSFQHFQNSASLCYATTTGFPTNPTWVQQFKNALKQGLDNDYIPRTEANKYRNSYRSDVIQWIGWGSYAQSVRYAWEFMRGYALWNDPAYPPYIRLNLDPQLGANPQNRSYITGVGDNPPLDPLHHPSYRDGIVPPSPGIPVFGPHAHMSLGNAWAYAAQSPENLYPIGLQETDPYPILRRYFDAFELVQMSEFGIGNIAESLVAYAFASNVNVAQRPAAMFKNFTAQCAAEGHAFDLRWENTTDATDREIVLETSADGRQFTDAGHFRNGTTSARFEPKTGADIPQAFRLRTACDDGSESFSSLVFNRCLLEKTPRSQVFPNPASDAATLRLGNISGENSRLRLTDAAGKTLLEMPLAPGTETLPLRLRELGIAGGQTLFISIFGKTGLVETLRLETVK